MKTERYFLTEQDLVEAADAIVADGSAEYTSDKYVHVPTMKVVRDLAQLGWKPIKAFQLNTRAPARVGYQKHMIVFQNPTLKPIDDHIPEIVMTNSHDGKSSFRFETGFFNTISLRRYVLSSDDFGSAKIRHIHYSFSNIQKAIRELVEFIPELTSRISKMQSRKIPGAQLLMLQQELMEARFLSSAKLYTFHSDTFAEDENSSLWDIYMELHMLIQDGGIKYINENGSNKVSPGIKNFYRMVKISKKVWNKVRQL